MIYRLILLYLILTLKGVSQDDYVLKPPRDYDKDPAKFAGFIELGGNGGTFSLNVDYTYLYREKLKLSGRFGFSPQPNGIYFEQGYILENNFILFKNPHHLELGFGATLQRRFNERCNEKGSYSWENLWFSVARIGYRFQKQSDGTFLRVGITPAIMEKNDCGVFPNYFQWWAGISIGFSF